MPEEGGTVVLRVEADATPFRRTMMSEAANASRSIRDSMHLQPLGRITGQANEFQKSLAASNARVIAFGASVGSIQLVKSAFEKLVESTISVERELANINAVLGLGASNLQRFSASLFNVANGAGVAFSEASKAAAEFSRQGLSVEDTLKRTNAALQLSRLSGMGVEEAVTSLTAALNSFTREALDAQEIVNRLTAVDAAFAVSSEDLAKALSRVSSSANDANVTFNQTIALVTAAQQITARGGSVIGNAFKSIFTRLQRPKVLDDLEAIGVSVRNANGRILPMIDILKNLSNTYDGLSASQKSFISETVGGVYQINILKAVLKDVNADISVYSGALDAAGNAAGSAERRMKTLNDTISGQLIRTMNELTRASSNVGQQLLGGGIRNGVGGFEKLLRGTANLTDPNATKEGSAGSQVGAIALQGSLKGLGNILQGPGIQFVVLTLLKLFERLEKFVADSAKDISGLNQKEKERVAINESVAGFMKQQEGALEAIITGQKSAADYAKLYMDHLSEATSKAQALATITKAITEMNAPKISLSGPATGGFALGFRPQTEAEGARQGGYNAGRILETTVRSGGKVQKVIANGAETKSTFFAAGGAITQSGKAYDFINPPQHSRAGFLHREKAMQSLGIDPYMLPQHHIAAAGAIPTPEYRKGTGGMHQYVLPSGGNLAYFQTKKDISINWTESKNKGEGYALFKHLALQAKLQGKTISTGQLLKQYERMQDVSPDVSNYENMLKIWPQLRYREIPGLTTSGRASIRMGQGAGRKNIKFNSLDELKERVNELDVEQVQNGLARSSISGLVSKFSAMGAIPNLSTGDLQQKLTNIGLANWKQDKDIAKGASKFDLSVFPEDTQELLGKFVDYFSASPTGKNAVMAYLKNLSRKANTPENASRAIDRDRMDDASFFAKYPDEKEMVEQSRTMMMDKETMTAEEFTSTYGKKPNQATFYNPKSIPSTNDPSKWYDVLRGAATQGQWPELTRVGEGGKTEVDQRQMEDFLFKLTGVRYKSPAVIAEESKRESEIPDDVVQMILDRYASTIKTMVVAKSSSDWNIGEDDPNHIDRIATGKGSRFKANTPIFYHKTLLNDLGNSVKNSFQQMTKGDILGMNPDPGNLAQVHGAVLDQMVRNIAQSEGINVSGSSSAIDIHGNPKFLKEGTGASGPTSGWEIKTTMNEASQRGALISKMMRSLVGDPKSTALTGAIDTIPKLRPSPVFKVGQSTGLLDPDNFRDNRKEYEVLIARAVGLGKPISMYHGARGSGKSTQAGKDTTGAILSAEDLDKFDQVIITSSHRSENSINKGIMGLAFSAASRIKEFSHIPQDLYEGERNEHIAARKMLSDKFAERYLEHQYASGNSAGVNDALRAENLANGGHSVLSSSKRLVTNDNPMGLAAITMSQGNADRAIEQHISMGQPLSSIRTTRSAGGSIPNLATDGLMGSSTLANSMILSLGSYGAQLIMSWKKMDQFKLKLGDMISAEEQTVVKLRTINREYDKAVQDVMKFGSGTYQKNTYGRNDIQVLESIHNEGTAKARQQVAAIEDKRSKSRETVGAFGRGIAMWGGFAGGVVSTAAERFSPRMGAAVDELTQGVQAAGQAMMVFPNTVGKIAAVGTSVGYAVSAVDIWSKGLANHRRDFDIETSKFQRLSAQIDSLSSSMNNFDTLVLDQTVSLETLVRTQRQYSETLGQMGQTKEGRDAVSAMSMAPDAGSRIARLGEFKMIQSRDMENRANIMSMREYANRRTFNAFGMHIGGSPFGFQNNMEENEVNQLMKNTAGGAVAQMDKGTKEKLMAAANSKEGFNSVLDSIRSGPSNPFTDTIGNWETAFGKKNTAKPIEAIRKQLATENAYTSLEASGRLTGFRERANDRQLNLDSALRREVMTRRLFVNQGAAMAGNTLDINTIGQRATYNAAGVDINRRQAMAGLYSQQYGERTMRQYQADTDIRRISSERQNRVATLGTQTTRSLVDMMTQNFDEYIKNSDLSKEIQMGSNSSIANAPQSKIEMLEFLNKGISTTVKGGNLNRFVVNGQLNQSGMIDEIVRNSGGTKQQSEGIRAQLSNKASDEILKLIANSNNELVGIEQDAFYETQKIKDGVNAFKAEMRFKEMAGYLGGIKNLMDRGSRRGMERDMTRSLALMTRGTTAEIRGMGGAGVLDYFKKSNVAIDLSGKSPLSKLMQQAWSAAGSGLAEAQNKSMGRMLNSSVNLNGKNSAATQGLAAYSTNAGVQQVTAALMSEFKPEGSPEGKGIDGMQKDMEATSQVFKTSMDQATADVMNFGNSLSVTSKQLSQSMEATRTVREANESAMAKEVANLNRVVANLTGDLSGDKEKNSTSIAGYIPQALGTASSALMTGYFLTQMAKSTANSTMIGKVKGLFRRSGGTEGAGIEVPPMGSISGRRGPASTSMGKGGNMTMADFFDTQASIEHEKFKSSRGAIRISSFDKPVAPVIMARQATAITAEMQKVIDKARSKGVTLGQADIEKYAGRVGSSKGRSQVMSEIMQSQKMIGGRGQVFTQQVQPPYITNQRPDESFVRGVPDSENAIAQNRAKAVRRTTSGRAMRARMAATNAMGFMAGGVGNIGNGGMGGMLASNMMYMAGANMDGGSGTAMMMGSMFAPQLLGGVGKATGSLLGAGGFGMGSGSAMKLSALGLGGTVGTLALGAGAAYGGFKAGQFLDTHVGYSRFSGVNDMAANIDEGGSAATQSTAKAINQMLSKGKSSKDIEAYINTQINTTQGQLKEARGGFLTKTFGTSATGMGGIEKSLQNQLTELKSLKENAGAAKEEYDNQHKAEEQQNRLIAALEKLSNLGAVGGGKVDSQISVEISLKDSNIPEQITTRLIAPLAKQLSDLETRVNIMSNKEAPQPAKV